MQLIKMSCRGIKLYNSKRPSKYSKPEDPFYIQENTNPDKSILRFKAQRVGVGFEYRNGKKVICYFSAGTKEDWRKDADQFPSDGLGVPNKHSPGETWVDITNIQVKRIMRNRTAIAKSRHCDGVVPTNVDGASGNQAGFYFTADNQLDYNRYLVTEAHGNDLAIGLMNDVLQLNELVGDFDFAINVSCMDYHECHEYKPFFYARKPVFHIQYVSSITEGYQMQREICSSLERPRYMNTIIKHKMVNWKLDC
ncbi:uncharacterized protein LOC127727174 [Mytilus californianus]|uniref:uncharacterized protein LOC127727174 n=1 Tax=Mytilus californianus TaxID=6549 RepID=UPI002246F244|nr:uncharacterized protein LOC127727174 [Mytilus californianus]